MERVVFLVEPEGARISALLNPESLTITRRAGLRARAGQGGTILGAAGADDPLIATGGGVTEIELHLLFDTDLRQQLDPGATAATADPLAGPAQPPGEAAMPIRPEPDVRDLTRLFWNLAEPAQEPRTGAPALVRFIWGRAWNLPVAVTAVAERFERFGTGGAPQRSWLSLRLRRVPEPALRPETAIPAAPGLSPDQPLPDPDAAPLPGTRFVQAISDEAGNTATPLYLLAAGMLGAPDLWPVIAAASNIDDPLNIPPGTVLTVPPATGALP